MYSSLYFVIALSPADETEPRASAAVFPAVGGASGRALHKFAARSQAAPKFAIAAGMKLWDAVQQQTFATAAMLSKEAPSDVLIL
jgi:hypothetical protein